MNEACVKCGYLSQNNKTKFGLSFCSVCFCFAPNDPEELDKYASEKIKGDLLNTFRKNSFFRGEVQKKAMILKASKGEAMSRVAFGYKKQGKKIVPAENCKEVEEIFEEFLTQKISLNSLAKKHNFSVNGLKKILKNFTYIGKIKFNNQIYDAEHQPLVSSTLFNHVQNKLEKIKRTKHKPF